MKKHNKALKSILDFTKELEGAKTLLRHSWLSNGRRESVAEHSWRTAMMAMLIYPYMDENINIDRVLKIILVHDIAEIYAGDHFSWKGVLKHKHEKEKIALNKLTKTLPLILRKQIISLWEEYEHRKTNEAKFAKALDKIECLIQHNQADLKTWNRVEHKFNITYGDEYCTYNDTIKTLKEMIRKETIKKITKVRIKK